MKKILLSILAITFSFCAKSQVAIGKDIISSPSVSLEFGSANKGILLPWVNSSASVAGAVDGTMIFDTNDKKVKYKKNGSWFDLTRDNMGIVDTSLQDGRTEISTAKVTIGANGGSDTTPGILVLSDTNKAMVLPKVTLPHYNIINPAPGLIVYDTQSHMLAVYNGSVWSFWAP